MPPMGEPNATAIPAAEAAVRISLFRASEVHVKGITTSFTFVSLELGKIP